MRSHVAPIWSIGRAPNREHGAVSYATSSTRSRTFVTARPTLDSDLGRAGLRTDAVGACEVGIAASRPDRAGTRDNSIRGEETPDDPSDRPDPDRDAAAVGPRSRRGRKGSGAHGRAL